MADAGVFSGEGQNLHQISSEQVQLVSIDVRIVLGRGPFLFDGGVAGMDRAEYLCEFGLRNLSGKDVDVVVGFPVNADFLMSGDSKELKAQDWVSEYAFMARDGAATYKVDFVEKPKKSDGDFRFIFTWKMHFAPHESRDLSVQYRIPISMGLVSTEKGQDVTHRRKQTTRVDRALENCALEFAGYITSTGSSWAGNVQSATFTVVTEPFERYLNQRGFSDRNSENPPDMTEAERNEKDYFPIRHPWWFRKITPEGWKPVKGGVQWKYTDYKPHDSIGVNYYITQIPRLANELDVFADRIVRAFGEDAATADDLRIVREIILATYGKEPSIPAAKEFSREQEWYSPDKGFDLEKLSSTQKQLLQRLDDRIAKASSHTGDNAQ